MLESLGMVLSSVQQVRPEVVVIGGLGLYWLAWWLLPTVRRPVNLLAIAAAFGFILLHMPVLV